MQRSYSLIGKSINGRMLLHAFALMRPWVAESENTSISDRLQSLEKNYRMTVDWFMSGADDPQRSEVVDSLVRESWLLLDDLYLERRRRECTSYEFTEMLRPNVGFSKAEDAFRYFWLRSLEEWDYDSLLGLVKDEEMEDEALMGISGLTLNLLRSFSPPGIICLMHAAEEQYALCIRERAWIGLLLVLLQHDEHLPFFPEIQETLSDLTSIEDGRVFACTALTCIVRTLGVDVAGESYRALQEQLKPLVNKMLPNLSKTDVVIPEQLDPDDPMQSEMSEVLDKHRREMMRLYDARLDTYFAMFSDMYTSSFFQEPYRWWLPFAPDYLPENFKGAERFLKLMPMDDMCDSDRYAFITTISQFGTINGQAADDVLPMSEEREQAVGEHMLTNDYVCQAYRFFRLNPWHIASPFDTLSSLSKTTVFHLLAPSAVEKGIVAEHCYRCHAWKLTSDIYQSITSSMNATSWHHYGVALQKQERIAEAIDAYRHSLKMNATKAVRYKLISAYEQQEEYAEALAEVEIILATDPEDARAQLTKAMLLAKNGLCAEALDIFYRLVLYHPEDKSYQEQLALVALEGGEYDVAETYFKKLLDAGAGGKVVLLNYAHLCFIKGRRMEAFEFYQQCMRCYSSLRDFLHDFRPDRIELIRHGVPKADVYLMEDQLIYVATI